MTLALDKVLVVEDEAQVSLLIHEMFKDEWRQIDFAETAYEALEVIERTGNKYDFIFLDLNLPDKKGLETVGLIRAASMSPVVAETGDIDLAEELEKDGTKFGVYGVIRKGSFVKHRIVAVIEGAIAKWKLDQVHKMLDVMREEKAAYRRNLLEHGH
ncbi:response regulator [Glutamicibacter sp.]|jgi:FOG: CheY-like receiver|uniref:response regulator n=1 Tax=Glutamicibacter sp. TaxID=1931995 RepID=UPI002FD90C85